MKDISTVMSSYHLCKTHFMPNMSIDTTQANGQRQLNVDCDVFGFEKKTSNCWLNMRPMMLWRFNGFNYDGHQTRIAIWLLHRHQHPQMR